MGPLSNQEACAMTDINRPARVRLFGQAQADGAYELRDFLQRSVVAFDWIELHSDEDSKREPGIPRSCERPASPRRTAGRSPPLHALRARAPRPAGLGHAAPPARIRSLDLRRGAGGAVGPLGFPLRRAAVRCVQP